MMETIQLYNPQALKGLKGLNLPSNWCNAVFITQTRPTNHHTSLKGCNGCKPYLEALSASFLIIVHYTFISEIVAINLI